MPLPALHLSLQITRFDGAPAHRAALARHRVARWLRHALDAGVESAEITVRVVDADEGRQLNRDYRRKDYATNVLTFAYGAVGDERGAQAAARADADAVLEGDLVLCVPVVVREAAEQGKTLDAHFAHLVVHGMLHLQGHDHEDDAQADAMESLERVMLAALGYPDPYA